MSFSVSSADLFKLFYLINFVTHYVIAIIRRKGEEGPQWRVDRRAARRLLRRDIRRSGHRPSAQWGEMRAFEGGRSEVNNR